MNYKIWETSAKSEYTCEFGKYGIRDVYTLPNSKIKIHDETILPRSIFQKQHHSTLIDLIYPISAKNELFNEGINFFDENRYTEEGYGYPVFEDENSTEKAFNFCESGKAIEILNKYS
jgi:hypothetical protein